MNVHQFASTFANGMAIFTLATGFVSGWRGFVRIARRIGN